MAASEGPSESPMRLIRHHVDGDARLAIGVGEMAIDVAALGRPGLPTTMEALLAGGDRALVSLREAAAGVRGTTPRQALDALDLLPPVARPGKIIAVGRNYREHASEEGVATPEAPVVFTKFTSSIVGAGDDIVWRASDSGQVDYEAELAVVIGRPTRDVPIERALDSVLGYTCLNDVSARDLQFADGQWVRGKSLDTFCPIGPWIVTIDEVPDPQALRIRCLVNGEPLQDASTAEMVHSVAELIAFCSRYMTLDPGDVIATGTPAGVGVFRQPPRFLEDGDDVVVDIEGIGRLENRCRVLPD
jgi:2-keto-4-pentenoate hydratase/2-oxohepta-3-ene-1,7-dioic acid hydratase in catechol pathway